MRRSRYARAAALLGGGAAAAVLVACSPEYSAVVGPTWQVTGLYTDPGESGDLPADAAGRAVLSFGEGTVTGSTGCSRIQGIVRFSAEGSPAAAQDADALTFDRVDIENAENAGDASDAPCVGGAAHVDATLRGLLRGEYSLSRPSEAELVLTQRSEAVDAPAIRLTTNAS
ncbi:hypothetical protein MHT86_06880 [Corynebacterium mastitidis]|uniref:META domain-containing protein n=1 Tax=Corynebacterium mastitidis TaxID=161890 RepID=A0A2N0X9H7_9CORY|nr:hypothetical protein [Corynebacterium mastitidis]MCH6197219.1 hypothetical protein [Corynebacterium mastitidis]PKF69352.1 hypothetical protein CXB45_02430 [Corynebacterium mastitidis]